QPGKVKCVDPPIVGIATTLDDSSPFKLVDERHHPAGHHTEERGQSLLAHSWIHDERAKHSRLRRLEIQLFEAGGKTRECMHANLSEEEGCGFGMARPAIFHVE